MRDFTSNIDDDSIFQAKADRSRPDMDPGMNDEEEDGWESIGSSDSGWSESFGEHRGMDDDFSSFNNRPNMGNRFGNDFNMGNNSGFSNQYGQMNPNPNGQNNTMQKNPEDAVWDGVVTGVKTGFSFLGDFVNSFKTFNLYRRKTFGKNLLLSGLAFILISIILIIVMDKFFFHLLIGSLFATGVGVIIFMSSMERLMNGEGEELEQNDNEEGIEQNNLNWNDEDIEDEPEEDNSFDNDDNDKNFDLDSDILDRIDSDDEIENPFENLGDNDTTIELSVKSKEEVIEKLESQIRENQVDTRMITKQYLYDMMLSTLETRTPNYYNETILDEDSREFLAFCDIVKKSSEVLAPSNHQEDLPEVVQIKDTLFFTVLEITRPKWLKDKQIENLVKEIVNACAFDPKTMEIDKAVTGSGTYSMGKIFIKIFKGETAMITLKDTYLSDKVRKEILEGKMKMPLVFGVDTQGEVVIKDFKDIHALLVAGAPRSGKTWFVKTLMAQLMMFKKPSEFEFYIIDAKTVTSDYFHLVTPHIKSFLTKDEEIIELFRYMVNEESNRREQLFYEKGGVQNIEDFKKKNPFEKMPYILIVMDEVITISNRMDKEMKAEFFNLLKQFTSRLPSLGIRILMVPHVIKNQVLDKTITDMIPYRISVKGDPEAVEAITGATHKEFPIRLNHMGDIAFKVDNSGVLFAHSPIISDTNEGFDDFFKFLTDFWLHIEPESFEGSKLEKDILKGLRKVDEYPAIKEEYKEEVNRKRAKIVSSRASKPQKPTSNKISEEPKKSSKVKTDDLLM